MFEVHCLQRSLWIWSPVSRPRACGHTELRLFRNSCLSSNRGLTLPSVTPSYCWNLPLPPDRNNRREYVGSSYSGVQNVNICWISWYFRLIFSLWTTVSPEQICCQFSDFSSWAIISSRREGTESEEQWSASTINCQTSGGKKGSQFVAVNYNTTRKITW